MKQKKLIKQNLIGYSFILPSLLGYVTFVVMPVAYSFILSFMKWDGSKTAKEFVGLQNFINIFQDRIFIKTLIHTIQYSVMTVPVTIILALLVAVLLNHKIRGIAVFRTAYFFPYVASIVAVGAVWNLLFQPDFGPINSFLRNIGISDPPRWVLDIDWAMIVVSIVSVWKYVGYYMVVYLAALQGISETLYEAASIDGATTWQKLVYVTIPLLTPTTFFVTIMLTIQCFKVFDLIFIMTGGGPGNATKTIVNYIYDKAFVSWDFGLASAGAMILFIVVLVITLIQFRSEKKWVSYM